MVILLGHHGLIGSAIAAHLRALGVEVVGVDRANYALHRGRPSEMLINADGSPDKRLAETDPLQSFRANVESTLASIVDFPTDRYVHVSTVSVYNHLDDPSRNHEAVQIEPLALPPYGYLKYLAESIVRKYAKRWLIIRLGPVVGPGLRRNPVFDLLSAGTLYVHPDSIQPYIDTRGVAQAVWALRDEANEIFNLAGDQPVRLSDLASELGIAVPRECSTLPLERMDVNIANVRDRVTIPDSLSTVLRFAEEWRAGSLRQPTVQRQGAFG